METILFLVFLVQYVAFISAVMLVGALVVSTVYELVRRKVYENRVLGSVSEQQAPQVGELRWNL
jgi:hypothetical protein